MAPSEAKELNDVTPANNGVIQAMVVYRAAVRLEQNADVAAIEDPNSATDDNMDGCLKAYSV